MLQSGVCNTRSPQTWWISVFNILRNVHPTADFLDFVPKNWLMWSPADCRNVRLPISVDLGQSPAFSSGQKRTWYKQQVYMECPNTVYQTCSPNLQSFWDLADSLSSDIAFSFVVNAVCTHLYQHNEGFLTDIVKRREWDSHSIVNVTLTGHTIEPIKRPKFFTWTRGKEAGVAPMEKKKKALIYYRALTVSASELSVWKKDLLALWKPRQPSHHLHQAPNPEQSLQIHPDEQN